MIDFSLLSSIPLGARNSSAALKAKSTAASVLHNTMMKEVISKSG